jgi:hypothetical protein
LIQSTFAAGMTAIPHLIENGGWITLGMVIALFVLLGVLHRVYIPGSAQKKAPEPVKPSA